MKDFWKYVFATVIGILLTATLWLLLSLCILACSITGGSKGKSVVPKDGSVLVVKLSGQIVEHVESDAFSDLLGGSGVEQQGLDEIVMAIDKAALCPEIRGIYIEAGMLDADYASLQEIRNALLRFKSAGLSKQASGKRGAWKAESQAGKRKFVVAYADEYMQGAYYVCSAADAVWTNPQGMVDLHGLSAQPVYIKDLLEKFGVKMTVVKVGKYKSATEQYTETQMSAENREQTSRYIENLWHEIVLAISQSRGIPADDLNRYADEMTALQDTHWLSTTTGLVDELMYADDVKGEIKKLLGLNQLETVPQVSCGEMCGYLVSAKQMKSQVDYLGVNVADDKIAVYYCDGTIAQNSATGTIMGGAGIISKTMVDDLDALAQNDDVKAVVIRINSGGGDAFASEEIWHSVVKLREKKPVVVSMGGMAASGAYYLSAGASWIVAQPTTLTGSIGIFGCFPNIGGLMQEKLGLHYDNVKTNKHADFDMTQRARPFDAEEQRALQRYIDRGYDLFCKRVADGRRLSVDSVKAIAQGRVWTGADAKQIGLVDQLGGLPEAVRRAAALAKLSRYELITLPLPASWTDQLFETVKGNGNNLDEQLRLMLGTFYEPFCTVRSIEQQSYVQARCEYVIIKN